MGQKPTEEELFQMISEVDENMSGAIGERQPHWQPAHDLLFAHAGFLQTLGSSSRSSRSRSSELRHSMMRVT